MMKENNTFEEIAQALQSHETFLVVSHVRPDGDAIGCQIAMAECLKALGKKVTVWNEDGVPEKFRFLPGHEQVTQPPGRPQIFDVAIAVDVAVHNRVGTPLESIGAVKQWINMDHHVTNDRHGDFVYIDAGSPATGQILFHFFQAMNLPISRTIADNLFAAVSTDTGSFQYPNTTAETFEIGAQLVRAGVDVGDISQRIYDSHPLRRIELMRELLNTLELDFEMRMASICLTQEASARLGVLPEDNEGLIDHIRAIEGVVVAAFFEELPEGKVRVSMRSKDRRVDVAQVCSAFAGGGHSLAAGARVPGTIQDVMQKVKDQLAPMMTALAR